MSAATSVSIDLALALESLSDSQLSAPKTNIETTIESGSIFAAMA